MSWYTKANLVITKNGQKIVMGGALRHNIVLKFKYMPWIPAEEGQRVSPFSSFSSFPSYRTFIQNICTPKCLQTIGLTQLDKKMLFKFKACGRKNGKVMVNSKGN